MTDAKTRPEDSVPEFVFGKWLVYLSAVGNYGLAIGLPFAMSVLFVDWQGTFGATRAQTAAVYSTNVSILFGAGIIPGFFIKRFGARLAVLVGVCLSCLGCIASSFATSISFLIFSNGVLGGLGFCFIQLPSMTAVNMAFTSRYRSMAVSVCTCCIALCSMIFPFLYRYLVSHYSWRGALAIIGGFALQTIVLGLVMTSYVRRLRPPEVSTENEISLISPEQTSNRLESKERDEDQCAEERKYSSLSEDVNPEKDISCPMHSCQYKATERTRRGCCHRPPILVSRLRRSRWKFLLDTTYLLYLVYLCTCIASMYSFVLMMMDFSRSKGFHDDNTGAFFMFLIFTTSIAGRLLIGLLNLIPFLHSIFLMGICGTAISLCFIALGNVVEYSTIVAFLAMTGLCFGCVMGIYTKAVLDIHGVTLEVYPLALGLAGTVEGIFDFVTPIIIGYSVDATGSYSLILHALGSISLVASIALIVSQGCSSYQTYKRKRTNRHSEDP